MSFWKSRETGQYEIYFCVSRILGVETALIVLWTIEYGGSGLQSPSMGLRLTVAWAGHSPALQEMFGRVAECFATVVQKFSHH